MPIIYIIFGLIIHCVPYTSSAKETDKELMLMKYRSRKHAWENFFMSWERCSDIEEFEQKLAYSHMIIMDAMEKVWDEPYIKRTLLFPIYHFKQYEKKTFRNAIECFLVTFDDPFAIPKDTSEDKKSNRTELSSRSKRAIPALGTLAIKGLSEIFIGFLGNIASEGLTGFLGVGDNKDDSSSATELPDVKDWKDMKMTEDKITVVLLGDRRFLRSFKFVIEDFQQYKLKCLDNSKRMTTEEHKFCGIKSHDESDPPESGAIAKIPPTFSFTALVIYTLFLVCTFY
ncbi:uncharacterized protein LOC115220626 [Octopus sinensis]|uniref:Uncharacterized protein LOC115220626 n=1 Tax=Octopus sinensis TaxID=2607531 RepID=A0A7E6FDJ9_9MOLL|nr:uncharacterized protein LOC115220626 [Octopus sinensis]XP_036365825.1 uncharacterized protein LOC115220626 [Octopus sinensis]